MSFGAFVGVGNYSGSSVLFLFLSHSAFGSHREREREREQAHRHWRCISVLLQWLSVSHSARLKSSQQLGASKKQRRRTPASISGSVVGRRWRQFCGGSNSSSGALKMEAQRNGPRAALLARAQRSQSKPAFALGARHKSSWSKSQQQAPWLAFGVRARHNCDRRRRCTRLSARRSAPRA